MDRRLRIALGAAALGVWAAAVSPPLDRLADAHLTAHMLEHVLVGDLAPALAAVALLPWLRRRRLPGPAASFLAWAAAIGLWHLPASYDFAEAHVPAHVAEHACFVAAGLLVWAQLVRLPLWRGVGLAIALLAGGMLLTSALIVPARPVYEAYPSLRDQQLAALVMTAEQLLTLGTFLALRLRAYARTPHAAAPATHPFAA